MKKKLKICIISEYAYSSIKNIGVGAGGAELQMVLLAKGLVKRDYDVNFVTFGNSGNSFEKISGINVFMPYNVQNRGYKHFYPLKLYKLFKLLITIDADIYVQRAGSPLTGIISFVSRLKNKKFIYCVSSNDNVTNAIKIKDISDMGKFFFKYGIKNSNCVVCQTKFQKKLLKMNLSKKGVVIKNIFNSDEKEIESTNGDTILWVGRIIKGKSPELFLKLAQELPEYNFKMIGGPKHGNETYYNEIKDKADKIKNLSFLGFIPHNQIEKYYMDACLFINTSSSEGFPNTFLEAWNFRIPILSLKFDPDNLITKYEMGYYCDDFDKLLKRTKKLLEDTVLRNKMGYNGQKYVSKEHEAKKIISKYEKLFQMVMTR